MVRFSDLGDPALTGPLIRSCEPMASLFIKRYSTRNPDVPDYVIHDWAYDGLMGAAARYDPSGCPFSQRAFQWIPRSIKWGIRRYRTSFSGKHEIIKTIEESVDPDLEERDFARYVASYIGASGSVDETGAQILRALFIDGQTLARVGEQMGVSHVTVMKLRDRSLQTLRASLLGSKDGYLREVAERSLAMPKVRHAQGKKLKVA